MTANHGPNRDDSLTPTPRDEGYTGDLGVVAIATTEQVAGRFWPEAGTVYFPALDRGATRGGTKGGKRPKLDRVPSPSSAERRMRKLKAARLLVRRGHRTPAGVRTSIWMLS